MNRRLLMGFAGSYLVLLVVPLAMGVMAYLASVKLSRDYTVEANALVLDLCAQNLDSALSTADSFANLLISDSTITLPAVSTSRGGFVYAIRKVIDRLPMFPDGDGIVRDYYILDARWDIVLKPHNGYVSSSRYFDVQYGGGDYSAWYESVRNAGTRGLRAAQGNGAPLYVLPYAASPIGTRIGSIAFELDASAMRALLKPAFGIGVSYASIISQSGGVVFEASSGEGAPTQRAVADALPPAAGTGNFDLNVGGVRMMVTLQRGSSFQLVACTPFSAIASRAIGIRNAISIGIAVMILMEIALALWVVLRNQAPIGGMIQALCANGRGASAIRNLPDMETAVRSLAVSQAELKEALSRQRALMKNSLVNRLVYGDMMEDARAESLMQQADFDIEGGVMRGIYMALRGPAGELRRGAGLNAGILATLDGCAPRLQLFGMSDEDCFILLYSDEGASPESLAELMKLLYSRLLVEHGVEAVFYVGGAFSELRYAHHSFAEARRLREMYPDSRERFVFESPGGERRDEYCLFDAPEEQKLRNILLQGDAEGAEAFLVRLKRSFAACRPDHLACQILYHRVLGVLARESSELEVPSRLRFSVSSMSTDEFFHLAVEHSGAICRRIGERQAQARRQMTDDIARYIGEHYADSGITLYGVALEFSLTESYLSTVIKSRLGETFSTRVERLRIEAANRLLSETDMNVADIAEKVGYTNANTFRRAYRRMMGFSPSQSRGRSAAEPEADA